MVVNHYYLVKNNYHMKLKYLGDPERATHYLAMTRGGAVGINPKDIASLTDDAIRAQYARREVEAYVMDKNLPGFTQKEHERMERCKTPEDIIAVVRAYFAREFPLVKSGCGPDSPVKVSPPEKLNKIELPPGTKFQIIANFGYGASMDFEKQTVGDLTDIPAGLSDVTQLPIVGKRVYLGRNLDDKAKFTLQVPTPIRMAKEVPDGILYGLGLDGVMPTLYYTFQGVAITDVNGKRDCLPGCAYNPDDEPKEFILVVFIS